MTPEQKTSLSLNRITVPPEMVGELTVADTDGDLAQSVGSEQLSSCPGCP